MQNYHITCCAMWVWNLVPRPKGIKRLGVRALKFQVAVSEDGSNMELRNVDMLPHHYTVTTQNTATSIDWACQRTNYWR